VQLDEARALREIELATADLETALGEMVPDPVPDPVPGTVPGTDAGNLLGVGELGVRQ
jgi:hypothetical protein